MKTILFPPAGRVLLSVLFCLVGFSAVFGQIPSFTQTAPDRFVFEIDGFPPLPRNGATSKDPDYEIYVHFGDGNVERVKPAPNGNDATGYKFHDIDIPHTYLLNGTYHPTFSLTAKYTPPSPPKREFFFPPGVVTVTGASGPFVQSPSILNGRSISFDTSHKVPYAVGEQASFLVAWARNPVPPGSDVVIFHGGLRDNSGILRAATSFALGQPPIMGIHWENPALPAQSGPAFRDRVTTALLAPPSAYFVLANKYDSAFVIPSLNGGTPGEGRFILDFRNKQDMTFPDRKISIFGVVLTKAPVRTLDDLNQIGNTKDLFNLGLQTNPDNNAFQIGNGYVYDWFLYEERPVYIHDPNELILTKMTKDPTSGDYDVFLDYTSCSHYKSITACTSANVIFDQTALVPASLQITGAEQGATALGTTGPSGPIPAGYFFKQTITGLNLQPGECFTMHFKGILPAAKAHLAYVDHKILHGCVELDQESNADPADVCRWNTKLAGPEGPTVCGPPCDQPGFWNKIKCLCANSPIPCWILLILVLVLLVWLFFKKKN